MAIVDFPPVTEADEHGLLAVGGDLEIPSLLLAYSRGIFPWPISEEFPLAWFSPDPRGLLFTDKLHIARSLKKVLNKEIFQIKINHNFPAVIKECAQAKNRKDGQGTWITKNIIQAYTRLFQAGYAYSVETYNLQDELVGGMYGVHIGQFFSGESMFYKEPNASKVALVKMIENLQKAKIPWLDTQMVTPVVESLGGEEIPREDYLKLLEKALEVPHTPFLLERAAKNS